VADFLAEKRNEIAARMRELEPLVAEYKQLEAAATALAGLTNGASTRPRRSRSAGRQRPASSGRRGRPRGTGTRALQALELVTSQPGITIPELAGKMGIKQNYLYRVLPSLEKDGKVVKRDRGWHPAK
jgi:hypothetical protein